VTEGSAGTSGNEKVERWYRQQARQGVERHRRFIQQRGRGEAMCRGR